MLMLFRRREEEEGRLEWRKADHNRSKNDTNITEKKISGAVTVMELVDPNPQSQLVG